MRITLYFLAFMSFISSYSNIVYTDLNPDISFSFNLPSSSTYIDGYGASIDLDGDNVDDFDFYYEIISGFAGITWKVQIHAIDDSSKASWASNSTYGANHYIKGLSYGDTIGSNLLFGTDTLPLLGTQADANIAGKGDQYIGVYFRSGSQTYYGWILVNLSYSGTSGTLVVKSFAYQDVANTSLLAGLVCNTPTMDTLSDTACNSYFWMGNTYFNSGQYLDSSTNASGCKAYHLLNLTILKSSSSSLTVQACDSFIWRSRNYTSSGIYQDTLVNNAGCDSILNLMLTIDSSTSSLLKTSSCTQYFWRGNNYTLSGIYKDTLANAAGCDSIIILDLTIDTNTSSMLSVQTCDSFIWHGLIFYSSVIFYDTINNAAGCDSIITLDLTINHKTFSNTTEVSCDKFDWRGNTYYSSGSYKDTLVNAMGCDSILSLELTINKSTTSGSVVSSCRSYSWQGNYYTSSGVYTDTISNAFGCDSIIVLSLTIDSVDIMVNQVEDTLIAQAMNTGYQWLDCADDSPISGATSQKFLPESSGNFAVEINDNGCLDTSACYSVTIVGIPEISEDEVYIYPNPTRGIVHLDVGPNTAIQSLKVTNIAGKVIMHKSGSLESGLNIVIDGSLGLYYLEVVTENGSIIRRKIMKY